MYEVSSHGELTCRLATDGACTIPKLSMEFGWNVKGDKSEEGKPIHKHVVRHILQPILTEAELDVYKTEINFLRIDYGSL